MDSEKIEELKGFVEHCKQNPSLLHTPPLAFFKNFLQSVGARIPAFGESGKDGEDGDKKPNVTEDDSSNDDIVESDVELDNSEVVEPDNDPPQKMGDPSAEVTEENQEAAQLSKAKAMEAIADGKFSEAIDYLTEAIMLNPKSAILYGNRASIFIKLKKPNAAIRDADAALQINPDSAKGYKARGMARAMLGLWEEAARDLHVASKLDFDEEIGLMLKMVEPNAKKIEEHNRKYERLRKEKEQRRIELERKRRQDAEAASVFKDGEIFEEEKVEEEEVEVEEEEVEVEVEKVEVEEEVEVEEVKEESVEKVHKWLFKEEEDMTWETYRYCNNWNTIERSILMETIHNFAKANHPKDYWNVRTWMNLSDTYNEMAVRTNQIKRSYHEIIGGGKYLQSLFTIERQRHFQENTPVDQILLDIFEPCDECRNRIPVFPKRLLYNGSNPSTSFGSRTDSSSHSKKQWTPDELELLKSTISDFSSASMPKPYWDVQLWTNLSETYNVQARFKNLNTVSYLEFIRGGMQLQSIFCEERLSYALHGYGSRGRDFVLMKIFEPCLECRKRIPVFPNGLPNNGSTSSARSIQSHFTSYEDESYYATLNNMLIVVREMFEKGLLTSAQLSIVTFKLHDFARTETWKICLLNNIFTLEMKREILIQSISPEA